MDVTEHRRATSALAGEKRLLEMIARGDSRTAILDALCRLVEELASRLPVLDPPARSDGQLPAARRSAQPADRLHPGDRWRRHRPIRGFVRNRRLPRGAR